LFSSKYIADSAVVFNQFQEQKLRDALVKRVNAVDSLNFSEAELLMIKSIINQFNFRNAIVCHCPHLAEQDVLLGNPENIIKNSEFLKVLKTVDELFQKNYQQHFGKRPSYYLIDLIYKIEQKPEPVIKHQHHFYKAQDLPTFIDYILDCHNSYDRKFRDQYYVQIKEFLNEHNFDFYSLKNLYQSAPDSELEIILEKDFSSIKTKMLETSDSEKRLKVVLGIANIIYASHRDGVAKKLEMARRFYLMYWFRFHQKPLFVNSTINLPLSELAKKALQDRLFTTKIFTDPKQFILANDEKDNEIVDYFACFHTRVGQDALIEKTKLVLSRFLAPLKIALIEQVSH